MNPIMNPVHFGCEGNLVMIKAIIFDFDGVLVDSVMAKAKAFEELFALEGSDVAKAVVEYHLKHTGVSRFEKFAYIYKNILRRPLTKSTFDELCRKFSKLVFDAVINASYINGAEGFLKKYAGRQYTCFVVSATPQKEIEEIIEQRKMSGFFKGIYGSPQKKADIVKKIICNNKFLAQDVVYIGDALSDYEAAIANSVNFIAKLDSANNGCNWDNVLSYAKIKDLKKLADVLKAA